LKTLVKKEKQKGMFSSPFRKGESLCAVPQKKIFFVSKPEEKKEENLGRKRKKKLQTQSPGKGSA